MLGRRTFLTVLTTAAAARPALASDDALNVTLRRLIAARRAMLAGGAVLPVLYAVADMRTIGLSRQQHRLAVKIAFRLAAGLPLAGVEVTGAPVPSFL